MATGTDKTSTISQAEESPATDSTAAKKGTRSTGILSVLLKVKKQGADVTWKIEKVSRVAEGRFKHSFSNVPPGYLKAYFTDDAGNKLDSNFFEHPLKRQIEAPTDDGKMVTGTVNSTEGTAYLRANNNAAITTLYIYDADNKKISSFHLAEY